MLHAERLHCGYGNRTAIHDIDLAVAAGEWLCVLGPNGSGKSTLLRALCRLLPAQSGVVLLDGREIDRLSEESLARALAWLGQQPPALLGLSVRDLVGLGRHPHRRWWQWQPAGEDERAIEAAMAGARVLELADRPLASLSGGERQRAFLALALAQETGILLLDEPTTHLDIRYQFELLDLLAAVVRERQVALVTVLHDLNLAARYANRLALMADGRLLASGLPTAVLTPTLLAAAFGVDAQVYETPVGPQVLVLGPHPSAAQSG